MCCVWSGQSPVELLGQELMGFSKHLVDIGKFLNVEKFLSWKDCTRDCTKLSILAFFSVSMFHASARYRVGSFFTLETQGGASWSTSNSRTTGKKTRLPSPRDVVQDKGLLWQHRKSL